MMPVRPSVGIPAKPAAAESPPMIIPVETSVATASTVQEDSQSPMVALPGSVTSFSKDRTSAIRGVLKVPSSPRPDPQFPSPKIPSSSSKSSPRVFFVSNPEEFQRSAILDSERIAQLLKVFSVFMNTQETIQKIAQQILEEMGSDQDEIFQAFQTALQQDEVALGKSFNGVVIAKEAFLKNFTPWYQALTKAVIPSSTPTEKEKIARLTVDTEVAKILNKELKKVSELNEKEEDEIDPLFCSQECQEFMGSLKAFKGSVGPLCQKYDIDFTRRLQVFRFLIRDKNYETLSRWIRHHFLQEFCAAKELTSNENIPDHVEESGEVIVGQKDGQLFANLFNSWGKKSALINYYNRALIQFYIRNTKLLFISSEEKAIRIRIFLLWELCRLSRFVNRLERYLGETGLQQQSLRECVVVILNTQGGKAAKIVTQAFDFLDRCQQVSEYLKMLSELSDSTLYPRLQKELQFKLVNYLSGQGFARKNPPRNPLPDIAGS